VNYCPQLSPFGDLPAHSTKSKSLKTLEVSFGVRLALRFGEPQEIVLILYALIAAVIILVAVTFISSIDFSNTRRR
jgi:hypothetical protein